MIKPKLLIQLVVSLIFLSTALTVNSFASPPRLATVITDRQDYPPGDTVRITGSSFKPNETVSVRISHTDGDTPNTDSYAPWYNEANNKGFFYTSWIVPEDAVGETLLVTAEGLRSGLIATTIFTDFNSILVLTSPLDDTLAPGDVLEFCVALYQRCPGEEHAPLTGRPVLFFFNEGGCGVNIAQDANDTVWTDADGTACFITTIPALEGDYSIRAKFRGEPKPSPQEDPNGACDPDKRINLSASNLCRGVVVDSSAGDYNPPVASCPGDTAIFLCALSEVCVPGFSCTDPDGNLESCEVFPGYLDGDKVCFTPSGEGDNIITLIATDSAGNADTCQTVVTVSLNNPPVCNLPDDSAFFVCGDTTFSFPVSATDADGNLVGCTKIAGPGVLSNGVWTFTTSGPGVYSASIVCEDECGDTCSGTVNITVNYNSPPVAIAPGGESFDTTIFLCDLDTIYISGFACSDPDGNLSSCEAIGGTYDGNGISFYPVAGINVIKLIATDFCGLADTLEANISVNLISPPAVSCPNDTSIFICNPDTLCFPVSFVPENASVTVFPPSTWYNPDDTTVCFYTNCSVTKDLKVVVESECGIDSCEFTVDVTLNSPPIVILPPDTAISACGGEEIRIPAGVADIDMNIETVTVTPAGYYDQATQRLCFTPDTTGLYTISVEAKDSCGGTDVDVIEVDVTLNSAPTIEAPSDTSFYLCGFQEVCIPVVISDIDNDIVDTVISLGYYNSADSTICFTPDTAGTYKIEIKVFDSCWAISGVSMATVVVHVSLDSPPEIFVVPDTSVFLCQPEPICIRDSISDPDNNLDTVYVIGEGEYSDGNICFTPTTSGSYTFITVAVDECSNTVSDTTVVEVILNSAPVVVTEDDFEVLQCDFEEICIAIDTVWDTDNNIQSLSADFGLLDTLNNQVCFTPDTAGTYTIIVTVADSCGESGINTTVVTVVLNSPPTIEVSTSDTSLHLCTLEEICIPIIISDDDNNIVDSSITPEEYCEIKENTVCFIPDTAGTYVIVIEATDSCGVKSSNSIATITVNVTLDSPPEILVVPDTSVFLCQPEPICIRDSVSDPDNNLDTVYVIGEGEYADGYICFTPTISGSYTSITVAVDECSDTVSDTTVVNVTLNSPPVVVTEDDFEVLQCDFEEICVAIDTVWDTDNNIQSLSADFGSLDTLNNQICFTPDTAGTYTIIVTVADSCGASDADTTLVAVGLNSAPTIEAVSDTSLFLCSSEEICIPFSADDIDGNLADVTVSPAQYFNLTDSTICFVPDTAGVYVIDIKATDSCGASSGATITVDVSLNSPPVIVTVPDTSVFLCQPEQVCIFDSVSDPDDNIASIQIIGEGEYADGYICFTPATSGSYTFITVAVDECSDTVSDTTVVNVTLNSAPVVVTEDDFEVLQCDFEEICIAIDTVWDIDNNIQSLSADFGLLDTLNDRVCFTPDTAGTYTIIVTVTDSCGAWDADTTMVTVSLNSPPVIEVVSDTSLFLCVPEEICIPFSVTDLDDNVVDTTVSPVEYCYLTDSTVCFVPDTAGTYVIVVEATDSCGVKSSNSIATITVNVTLDSPPEIFVVPDTSVFLCQPEPICIRDSVSDPDNNIASIQIIGEGEYADGYICFTPTISRSYTFITIVTDECSNTVSDTTVVNVILNSAPVVVTGDDFEVLRCDFEEICVAIDTVWDIDNNLQSISANFGLLDTLNNQVCFTPDTAGTYTIIVTVADSCGAPDADTTMVTVRLNSPPVITTIDTAVYECVLPEMFSYEINADDADNDVITYKLLSSYGQIDNQSGVLSFQPDTAGVYCFEVEASDYCSADTATVCVTIASNSAPVVVSAPDTTIMLCTWEEICLRVDVSDVDGNIVNITVSPSGHYNAADSTVCFTPTEATTYTVVTSAVDSCGAIGEDTTVVTVLAGEALALECPGDTSAFICHPDTLCFPVGGILPGANITVWPQSAWYDAEKGSVCFYTNCSVTKDLKIVVDNECASDSCMFTVDVTLNSRPVVIFPPDIDVTLCEPEGICIPVGINDADNDIVNVFVSDGASYDPVTGKICFTPPGAGVYTLKALARDACGAQDLDSIVVTVTMNSAPWVSVEPVIDRFQCELAEICFPVDISDSNNNILSIAVSPYGEYDTASGEVCFTPPDSGSYQLTITVSDSCGLTFEAHTTINVSLNSPPAVAAPDTSIVICEQGPLCIPISVSDVNENIDSIYVAGGAEYYDSLICFASAQPGTHSIIITAVDSCGATGVDTMVVDIILNQPPQIVTANDSLVTQCVFEEICVAIDTVWDQDNNIQSITSNIGVYDSLTHEVCFTPTAEGSYVVVTTVVDECGLSDRDTTVITVIIGDTAWIDCPGYIDTFLCAPQTVCYPLEITPEDAVVSIVSDAGAYYQDGNLCFYADSSKTYTIEVTAEAECGTDVCTIEFAVEIGEAAQVWCPQDSSVLLCEADSICFLITSSPDYAQITVPPFASYDNGRVCFFADTAGVYSIPISAETDCGTDVCTTYVNVTFNTAPIVAAGSDSTYFQCVFEEICQPVDSIVDRDNSIDSVIVSPVGYYDYEAGTVCFTPTYTGAYCLTVTAYDECGAIGVDTVCITVTSGEPAHIVCPDSIHYDLCGPNTICIPLEISPDTADVQVSYGMFVDGGLCFYADTSGVYRITVIASDTCGSDTCVVVASVEIHEYPVISGCPVLPVAVPLCEPDTVRIDAIIITPSNAELLIEPFGVYDFENNRLSFFADTSGRYTITITAMTPCDTVECVVQADVTLNQPPALTCPDDFDTLVCLSEVSEICFDVPVTGTSVEVTVEPAGYFSGNQVCIPVTEATTYVTTITASNVCGDTSCTVSVTVLANQTPELTVPDDMTVPWCDDDTGQVCVDGIFATDQENDSIGISLISGFGSYNDTGGYVCFDLINIDSTYEFVLVAEDYCSADTNSFFVTVYPSAVCSVCVDVSIETDSCVVVGSIVPVKVVIETNDAIGGFDLLIGYDASVLSFYYVTQGEAVSGWEYFTYRIIDVGDCGAGCPAGLVRIVAIADQNDGPFHPPQEQLMPDGILAQLRMRVANDQNLGGQHLPISFYWMDCGDNSFADPTPIGKQYIDARIYNAFGSVIWDESDDILFPESERPNGLGAGDSCITGFKTTPVRCVYFHNGGICVKHPDSIDARGDINLNGVAYEIADAVVFTNYFIYGLAALIENADGQIAASDVNADGFTLTVADLVYLIRVITGDADPLPKLSPNPFQLDLRMQETGDGISVTADADCPIGAGLLVFSYDGVVPEIPQLGSMAEDMDIVYAISNSEIRVLIYSFEAGRAISTGKGELLKIAYRGTGSISLTDRSFASYQGEAMESSLASKMLPESFSVSQNYPNPFNPRTAIDLSLPFACRWAIDIYNINGRLVKRFGGDAEPGVVTVVWDGRDEGGQTVASGIYFYKVEAGGFAVTRKMALLK